MDDNESEQLDQIYSEVRRAHGQLGRIDERTRNMSDQLDEMDDDISENREDIDELQASVKRNTTIISGVTGGLSMVLLWVSDKLSRII